MNPNTVKALKEAAGYLKSGNTKGARPIILQILREEPENVQAWYMLSFAVPRQDKQIQALENLLKIDPNHEKAKDRLLKLGGTLPTEETELPLPVEEPSEVLPEREPQIQENATPALPPTQESSAGDLLSQRLFGDSDNQEDASPTSSTTSISQNSFIEDDQLTSSAADSGKEDNKAGAQNKIFGLPRRTFLIIASAVVLIGIALVIIIPSLNSGRADALSAVELTATANFQEVITSTPTVLPTATPLPPTPTPIPPTPTPEPFSFSTSGLLPIDDQTLASMEEIQSQLGLIMELESPPEIENYTISQSQLEELIRGFDKLPDTEQNADDLQSFYTILGLAESSDDFDTFYINTWVDPNGTLFFPNKNFIASFGFEISAYQKLSYAQAYIQHIRNSQYPFEAMKVFPPCDLRQQSCEVSTALVKGEAAAIAMEWAQANLTEEEITKIQETTQKTFFIYPIPAATNLMEEIRLFPYEKGATFVSEIYASGGIEALNNLYLSPPTTTEQILHPEKYLQGEEAVIVQSIDISELIPSSYHEIFTGSFGEWKTYLLLTFGLNSHMEPEVSSNVAAGWAGDHLQIYQSEDGGEILAGHWAFDTYIDTVEFQEAVQTYAFKLVSGVDMEIQGLACNQSYQYTTCISSNGSDVLWFLTPDQETMELLIANYSLAN